jgi:hypothetical protein
MISGPKEGKYLKIRLKEWDDVLRQSTSWRQLSAHYYKIYHQVSGGMDVLAVRDYYKSYFGKVVTITPKLDRYGKKMPRIYWIVQKNGLKNGKGAFAAHRSWFIVNNETKYVNDYKYDVEKNIIVPESVPTLSEVSWDQLFEV